MRTMGTRIASLLSVILYVVRAVADQVRNKLTGFRACTGIRLKFHSCSVVCVRRENSEVWATTVDRTSAKSALGVFRLWREQRHASHAALDGLMPMSAVVQCSAGTFATSTSMTACVPCDTGRYQQASGQSACTSCSDVQNPSGRNAHLWTTMEAVVVEGQVEWREVSASGDVSQCGCRAGAWADDEGHCHECGQGIICKAMGVMDVLPGFFASPFRGDFVWQCHGEDWKRCPGGHPGTCAEHRINTSIACDECEPFTRMTNDGPCEQCTGPDIGLLVAVLVVVVAFLWCVYWVSAKENRRERKNVFTLAAIVGSQFVTLFQMVGALASLSVAWPEPFARIVRLGSLVNFRVEVLNLGCVVATRPLQR